MANRNVVQYLYLFALLSRLCRTMIRFLSSAAPQGAIRVEEIENPQDNVPLEDVIKDGNANEINQQATMKSYLMTRTTGHPLERIHSVITGIGEVVGLAE